MGARQLRTAHTIKQYVEVLQVPNLWRLKFAEDFFPKRTKCRKSGGKHECNYGNIQIKKTFYLVAKTEFTLCYFGVEKFLNRKVRSDQDCEDCWRRLMQFTSFGYLDPGFIINLSQCQRRTCLMYPSLQF